MNKLKHFYYYLYYCGYWASYDLGNADIPYHNAFYFLTVIGFGLLFSIFNLIRYFLLDLPAFIVGIIGVVVYFVNHALTLKHNRYKKFYSEFSYLKEKEHKKERLIVVGGSFLLFFILTLGSLYVNIKKW